MLSKQKADELQIVDNIPPLLYSPSFLQKKPIWTKDNHHPFIANKQISNKRYEYIKIGKTFGFQMTRYITFAKGYLFYYDNEADINFKGYASLQNVYLQFFVVKSNRYLLFLTNGSDITLFYFNTLMFWHQFRNQINKYVIQLNFKDNYQIIEQIGKGSFSKVYKVRNYNNKKYYAAKIINKKDKHKNCTKSLVLQQRKILCLIKSQYVYNFQQIYEEEDSYIFIIQYLPGSDLMVLFKQKKITEPQVIIKLLKQILEGLRDIHHANVIHRDLKPQNILVDLTTMKPYIIDFGLSLVVTQNLPTKNYKRCGTMGYMAPEVIQNTGQHKKAYNYKCDIFSVGIIAHMLLLGFNPLKGENYDETFLRNKACQIQIDKAHVNNLYGEHCFIFLTKLLSKYHQFRFDASQALNNLFLKSKIPQKSKQQSQKFNQPSSSTIQEKKKINKKSPQKDT